MRDYILITVAALGAVWAFDAYKFDGRYSQAVWQQTVDEGRALTTAIHSELDRAMSGKCVLCD